MRNPTKLCASISIVQCTIISHWKSECIAASLSINQPPFPSLSLGVRIYQCLHLIFDVLEPPQKFTKVDFGCLFGEKLKFLKVVCMQCFNIPNKCYIIFFRFRRL
jgi:hypothetical protein